MPQKLIDELADYFTGPDLALCSLAIIGPHDSTAYKRAARYFKLRDAFNVPRSCEDKYVAASYIQRKINNG